MEIKSVGHVVVRVTDLERSEAFYAGLLGLPVCARLDRDGFKMLFFTLGNHHDFALMQVSGADQPAGQSAPGLDHVAFNIGTNLDELRDAKAKLEEAGIAMRPVDHVVSQSLYIHDPDGNGVELYVDGSDVWRQDPQSVAQVKPLVM